MTSCKIVVVMPVYNAQITIRRSLESLVKQTFDDWICVIVNDGSTDDTLNIINAFNESRFQVVSLDRNQGRGVARSIGLSQAFASGAAYMCMLDADDYYYEDKLERQYEFMETNGHIALASFSMGMVNEMNSLVRIVERFSSYKELTFDKYEYYIEVPHASSIIRIAEIGQTDFNTAFKYAQDQDFMLRMLLKKNYAFVPNVVYLYYREGSFSLSKYLQTIDYNVLSRRKVGVAKYHLLKITLKGIGKKLLLVSLSKLGCVSGYLNAIGRKPSVAELNRHEDYKHKLSRIL